MVRSEASQPTGDQLGFVLLHGAMLGRWIWARVEPLLTRPALAVDLPGRDTRPAAVTKLKLDHVIDSVASDIDSWSFDQVVLVAHSLSGILIPAPISRLARRPVHAVFVSAAVPEPGTSYLEVLPVSQRLFLRFVLLTQRKGVLTVASSDRDGSDRLTDAAVERLFEEARAAYFDRCTTVDESSLSIEASSIGSQRAPVSDAGVTVSVSVVEVFPESFTMSARLRPREGDGIAATASCRLSPGGPVLPAMRDEFIAVAHRATHMH